MSTPDLPQSVATTCILWLRTALRIHDNPLLAEALAHDCVLPVYVFDPSEYEAFPGLPFRKTGEHRLRFLLESLTDLQRSFQALGSDIAFRTGDPATALAAFAKTHDARVVYVDDQPGTEEQTLFGRVRAQLPSTCSLEVIWEKTVYHVDDLPFGPMDCPERFKFFWDKVTKQIHPRDEVATPATLPALPADVDLSTLPSMAELGFSESEIEKSKQRAYPGGETAGLKRLHHYSFETEQLTSYRWTRNRSLGADYSSKFSAYLCLGCLSARRVWREVKRYEQEVKKNASTYWLIRELIWRDFYQILALKYPRRMFWPSGIRGKGGPWREDQNVFTRWTTGTTGIPFLDAHMRELDRTGFMSNRGRVNASSWLSKDQGVLWTWGAAWFESRLIDYDVASNWLNWNFQATILRPTNPIWQGQKYDAKGEYVYSQIPELEDVPAPLVHGWFGLSDQQLEARSVTPPQHYDRPPEVKDKWNWALKRIVSAADKKAGFQEAG